MRTLLPRPANYTQADWDEILILETPSVLGLASSAADVLDPNTDADTPASSRSNAGLSSPSTSVPYSPSSSASHGSCINIDMSALPQMHTALPPSPAENMARTLLSSGAVTGRDVSGLLDLLPHSGRPVHQELGHGFTQQPRQFTAGAYAHGPNAGIMRTTRDYPLSTLLLSRVMQSCAPGCCFSSLTLTRNLLSSMHRDSYNSRLTPNILVPLSHFQHGGLWIEDAAGDIALGPDGPLGRDMPILRPYTILWPHQRHATLPWRGDRLVLIGYHIGQASRLSGPDRRCLAELGFCVGRPRFIPFHLGLSFWLP